MTPHSPFYIIEELISPAACERLITKYGLSQPSLDENDKPIKYERLLDESDALQIGRAMEDHRELIEKHYAGLIGKVPPPTFQQYFEDPTKPCEQHGCENAIFLRKKWVKRKEIDLVGFLWLKSFNSSVPIDPRFEVYGAKIEFPAYDFSLMPSRGTLVLFPAGPHFITATSHCMYGSMEQIKIGLPLTAPDGAPWLYQPAMFGGTWQDWFK